MEFQTRTSLIACGIFRQELMALVGQGAFKTSLFLLNPGLHNDPPLLEKTLRKLLVRQTTENPGNVAVLYGDVCLGFQGQMKALAEEFGVAKVDALNCIDCYLGGKSRLLAVDPGHEYFFLNPSWIDLEFGKRDLSCATEESRQEFSMLKGLYLLDTLGDLDQYEERIQQISRFTELPVVAREDVGLEGLRQVIDRALASLPSASNNT